MQNGDQPDGVTHVTTARTHASSKHASSYVGAQPRTKGVRSIISQLDGSDTADQLIATFEEQVCSLAACLPDIV